MSATCGIDWLTIGGLVENCRRLQGLRGNTLRRFIAHAVFETKINSEIASPTFPRANHLVY